jgi:outer membrane protein assembly factor BamA
MAGIQVAYYDIGDYTGETHDDAIIQPTHLRSDFDAGRIKGFNGGWDNSIRLGLTYDTRDFAPNPSNGLFLQAIGRASLKAFGSSESYGKFKLEARGFYSPFPRTRLTASFVPRSSAARCWQAGGLEGDAAPRAANAGPRKERAIERWPPRPDRFA